ncbi:MAG: hypothetical protein Q4B05_00560 [Candidatus Saccharibacteria bacterium]|nr:hypothetical protein [Candidatus Saccharibacteria bacterium]
MTEKIVCTPLGVPQVLKWPRKPEDLPPREETVVRLKVPDAYAVNSRRQEEVADAVAELTSMGFYGETSRKKAIARKRGKIDYDNPATQALMEKVENVIAWLERVPTAKALAVIYDPKVHDPEMSEAVRTWVTYLLDGIGIRSRAKVMQRLILEEWYKGRKEGHSESQRWLSLACGAAQPVIQLLGQIKSGQFGKAGQLPRCTLVDLDRGALQLAKGYADASKVADAVMIRPGNILADRFYAEIEGVFDVVEAVGFFEYLSASPEEFQYNGVVDARARVRSTAGDFLRNAYQAVAPGGLLVIGNMLDTHPQLGFTLNVVQWPHIQPRSMEEMCRIIHSSLGTAPEDVTIYAPNDGVYALYAIRKPENSVQ